MSEPAEAMNTPSVEALEGSQALARIVARCRPEVVAAYPITPQTHIVENISKLVADGELECELVSVESEFSAASVVLGAASAGARAYTASASQGVMLMAEVLFNIAGLRVPLVMTCANRAVGAPLNIWNDQSDSMAVRDAGWIQLYCADNQEAVDTTVQAFRIAEQCELPVMVCVDGFTLTHTLEALEIPSQAQVDTYLPPFAFGRALDPRAPTSVGTLVDPNWFSEARHSHHQALNRSAHVIAEADAAWTELTGRDSGGLLSIEGPTDARIGVLTIGSMHGTLQDGVEAHPDLPGVKLIRLRCFRPFPDAALREASAGLDTLVVLERAFSPGQGGIVGTEVRAALAESDRPPRIHNFALGLGGRDIPLDTLPTLLRAVDEGRGRPFEILDVNLDKLPEEER
ncbi:MAG: pyruvate ferredoxin oxidoreductase [Gammaproteobacteria bacterium]